MWCVITSSLVLMSLVQNGATYAIDPNDDTETHIIYRPNSAVICPPRAVCGDRFSFRRTLNGETREERRMIYNCRCNGDDVPACPIADENLLHASYNHKQFLCQPIARLPVCTNDTQVAEVMVEESPEFNSRSFFRIKCICPRHLEPQSPIPGQLLRATSYVNTRMNWLNSFPDMTYDHEYVCSGGFA